MRKITLFGGQWIDLSAEQFLKMSSEMGYDGVDLIFRPEMLDLNRVIEDEQYYQQSLELLDKYHLTLNSISAAYIGKCVGDVYDVRHNTLVPEKYHDKPEEIRKWAIDTMMRAPEAAKKMNCHIIHSFLGSPIWGMFYSYPRRSPELVEEGFERIAELWLPILDEFERQGTVLAFEVHPSEIAYDYYTLKKLMDVLKEHSSFCLNYDASHILWQGLNPVLFAREFADRIVNVHIKDVKIKLDGKSSVLGSHLPFGDSRRGWDFRTPGHGDVPFEEIIRELNYSGYRGALTVEWEDNGMNRYSGAKEALEYVKKLDFPVSDIEFDAINRYG